MIPKLLTLFLLLCAHLPTLVPFFQALKQRILPRSIDVICASCVMYFDLEITFEAFGGHYRSLYYRPFFSADEWPLLASIIFIAATPLTIKAGYLIVGRFLKRDTATYRAELIRPTFFYLSSLLVCILLCMLVIWSWMQETSIWFLRQGLASRLGAGVAILYIPLGILCFYVRQPESHKALGKLFLALITGLSMFVGIGSGERTLVLMPLLIVLLFWKPVSLRTLTLGASSLVGCAVLLVPVFKAGGSGDALDEAAWVFMGDIGRAPAVVSSVGDSPAIGTTLMPYAGAGYTYFALFLVPRSIAPFKGQPAALMYTAKLDNTALADTHWILGIGLIDDVALNFGWVCVLPVLMLWGAFFGVMDFIALRIPVFTIVGRFGGIWFVGYGSEFFMHFMLLAVIGLGLHAMFIKRRLITPTIVTIELPA